MVTSALSDPVTVGLNVTLTVQISPGTRLDPQLFVSAKSEASAPVMAMLVMLTEVVDLFSTEIVLAPLVVPTETVPKFSFVGESSMSLPVPDSGIT
jgi:hypothetical protein